MRVKGYYQCLNEGERAVSIRDLMRVRGQYQRPEWQYLYSEWPSGRIGKVHGCPAC